MICYRRWLRRCLVVTAMLGIWSLAFDVEVSRADLIVSTLDLPNDGTFPGEQVGAAIQIGSTAISLDSVVYVQSFSQGPVPGETFAIFSRNLDGTVGSSIFNAFTLSYDDAIQQTTATATSPFTLQANTSYWLMMVETPGTFGDWDNSLEFTYTSNFGVTVPIENTSVSFFDGAYAYANAEEGLQLFQLNGTPVITVIPEPSTITLASIGAATVLLGCRRRLRGS